MRQKTGGNGCGGEKVRVKKKKRRGQPETKAEGMTMSEKRKSEGGKKRERK